MKLRILNYSFPATHDQTTTLSNFHTLESFSDYKPSSLIRLAYKVRP
jgi:hypothetical protein